MYFSLVPEKNGCFVEDRVVLFIIIFIICALIIAPVRQFICVVGTWRNLPNVRNKNAPVILENKKSVVV